MIFFRTGKCQNLNVSESLVAGRCQEFKMSNLNVSEPDSVRILTLPGSEKFSYLKIVKVESQKQKFKVLTTLVKKIIMLPNHFVLIS